MAFALKQRGNIVQHTDPNQYGQYMGGTTGQLISRFGDSTSVYADTLVQRDTTNGYITRFGYGAAGFETWMVDISKNKVVIRNGVLYCQGPFRYDAEAYASASDLDSSGKFRNDANASPACTAAATAIRAATITALSGASAGYGHSRRLVINSPVARLASPVNWTKLSGCIVETGAGRTVFYSGDNFAAAGAYLNGVSNVAGVTIGAEAAPMLDTTGCQDTLFIGFTTAGQLDSGTALGPATTRPATVPGCGWLIASTETRAAGTFATNANSNNCVWQRCSALGYFKIAPVVGVNTVIHKFMDCGFQQYNNETQSRVMYFGVTTLSSAGVPSTVGTGIDSPFYPNPSAPADGDERMCRTEVGTGAVEFFNTEAHDMTVYNRIQQGGSSIGQGNLSSSILLYKTIQMTWNGGPMSTSGGAILETQGNCNNTTLRGIEFYNDASNDGASGANTYGNAILHVNGGTLTRTSIENCVLDMPVLQAAIKGSSNAVLDGLRVTGCSHVTGTLLIRTNYSFTDPAATVTLRNAYLECGGRAITVGGSIGGSVEMIDVGAITVSGGGTDSSHKWSAAGYLRVTDGTVGTPAYAYGSEFGLGWYRSASHQMALSSNNLTPVIISDTQFYGPSGTVTNPGISFTVDGTKGIYHSGSNLIGISIASTKRLEVTSTGVDVTGALTATTSVTAPFASLGTTPATAGEVRLPSSGIIGFRNVANSGNITAVTKNASDNLTFGNNAAVSVVTFAAANGISIQLGGSASGNIEVGTAALATNASAGHFCIPSCAGAATGAVTPTTGLVAVVYDSTNNKIYVRSGGTWRSTAALT